MAEGSLAGKVAIVTGGGRGLGRAAALAFAQEGARVAVVSRTQREVEAVAAEIGNGAIAVTGDVSREETVRRVVGAALERFGGIDILMNNAAVVRPMKRMTEVEPAEWDAALGANLRGAFLFSREVAPHMEERDGGAIINVTSGLGERVLSPFGVYCVSKAALNQLTRILALELAEKEIAVNALDPGVMDTPMQGEIRGAGPERLGRSTWEHFVAYKESGMLDPAERTARLALFLASPPPSVNGEIGDASHYRRLGFRG